MRKIASLFTVTCALAAGPAWATNGMRMIGFGPVQDSMGGASVAAPLDTATIVSNPAGLSALPRELDLAVTFFKPTVSYDAQSADPVNFPIASGNTIDSDRGPSYIPTVGFSMPLSEQLAVGAALVGVSGMGVDYPVDLYGGKTLTSYMNVRLAPAISYKYEKVLSVGLAVNLMYATMKYEVAGGMGMLPRDTKSALGAGVTLGAQFTPVDMLTVGVAYESKSNFQDFTWSFPSGDEKLAFDQPQALTGGVAVRPVPGLTVAADVQWINWSDTNGKDKPEFTTNPQLTGAMPWNMNWSDQVVLKIGAEYAATKELKLRLGYNYGKMPLDKNRAFENIAFPAVAEQHIALGAGYAFGSVTANATVVYSPEATISGSNAMEQGIGSYDSKMSQLQAELGIAYRF